MEMTMQQALAQVKKYIDEADEAKAHLVFFNRRGEIDRVSEEADNEDALNDEAKAQSGGPYFEILSINVGGDVVISGEFYLDAVADAVLQEAITDADNSRTEFYAQRAEEFGASAYPMTAGK